jgi:hypothetical protein
MVADLPDFGGWSGSVPFSELRKASPELAARNADRMRTLHYWGQFTSELPAPFAADGGHQYVQCASEKEARGKLAELVAAVKAKFPAAEVSEDDDQVHVLLPGDDDDRQMTIELSPANEYDASWQSNEEDECWIHAWGEGQKRRGLFWEMEGGGVADVAVNADATEIVLLRTWVDEDADEAKARAHVDRPRDSEERGPEITIGTGKAVVVWSPVAAFQLTGIDGPDALLALGDDGPAELDTAAIGGVGVVLKVKPGRWVASWSSTDAEEDGDEDEDEDEDEGDDDDEDDDASSWSCRWVRLQWIGA